MTRDTCIACGRLTHTLQIFIFQLVNTGLTPLLVALFSVRSQRESQREKEASVAEYDYQLDTAWYELASSAVLLTMTALWLSLGSWPFVASLFDTMRRRRAQTPPCSAALQPLLSRDCMPAPMVRVRVRVSPHPHPHPNPTPIRPLRKLAPKAVTAHGLRALHTGPPFRFALRVELC